MTSRHPFLQAWLLKQNCCLCCASKSDVLRVWKACQSELFAASSFGGGRGGPSIRRWRLTMGCTRVWTCTIVSVAAFGIWAGCCDTMILSCCFVWKWLPAQSIGFRDMMSMASAWRLCPKLWLPSSLLFRASTSAETLQSITLAKGALRTS